MDFRIQKLWSISHVLLASRKFGTFSACGINKPLSCLDTSTLQDRFGVDWTGTRLVGAKRRGALSTAG
ncbi:MAG TPA: hypothetical protein PKN13_01610, partial [Accumulibacter sp.]|nr:hypothetical protein [Accumulibacter sp.]HMW16507.1 hypothetical protein [Accumulibacter sp.]HNC16825.1 hypothetical protein [Accumulibacter sp.]HNG39729.1 hypothetical protein [Accumulibacter sp.]HNI74796.1 hypothetical protein [Accumulibacter sp.]